MAANISRAQLEKLRNRYQSMQARVKNLREKANETVGQLIQTTEVSVAAFGLGLINGRFVDKETGEPGVEILGVPLDLGAAVVLHGIAFVGGGKYSEHMHNLGDGALAAYLTTMGVGVGTRMRQKNEGALMPGGGGGALPTGGASGTSLSNSELAALARA